MQGIQDVEVGMKNKVEQEREWNKGQAFRTSWTVTEMGNNHDAMVEVILQYNNNILYYAETQSIVTLAHK